MTEHLHLSRATKFLAVTLMDHFMDKHAVMEFRMKLVALTCLQVSGMKKMKEERKKFVLMFPYLFSQI